MLIQEEIGTVEPIGYFKDGEASETIAFIRGAIEKYAKHEEFHESLISYIKKLVNTDDNSN